MLEKVNLAEFDILGIIKLNDVSGIEKYVTPVYDGNSKERTSYFSRSKEYYNVKSLTELSQERELLKSKLTREKSKRNFVILENMLNCSAKVYFKNLEQYIDNPENINNKILMEISEKCLLEDTRNIIAILSNKGLISCSYNLKLPYGDENCAKRAIEMDNKAMLYLFAKNIEITDNPEKIQVLTPGYGSIYIGPFFKILHGCNYTNLLKSKYINETSGLSAKVGIENLISNEGILESGKKVFLLDDNIGTGKTMEEIKELLTERKIPCYKSGAIQYNWRNYFKISIGEKTGIDRFEVNQYDIISPFNYAGHKLYSRAIDMLHSSGSEYEGYLKSKSYRLDICSDMFGAIKRGIICANKTGLDLTSNENSNIQLEEQFRLLPQYENCERNISEENYSFIDRLISDVQIQEKELKSKENIDKII